MAQTVILEEQTFSGFVMSEAFGYMAYDIQALDLTVGERYVVVWDGVSYPCTAQEASVISEGVVGLGNLSSFGLVGNNEPFAIGDTAGVGATLFSDDESATSHTVAIYHETARENLLGTLFSAIASAIRSKTGETGTMKPAEFAEKIEGMTVGGSSGDAPSGLIYAEGRFTANTAMQTVTHNLGYIPDIMIIYSLQFPVAKTIFLAQGFSQAMFDALGEDYCGQVSCMGETGGVMSGTPDCGFESDMTHNSWLTMIGAIRSMTTETFVIGGTTYGLNVGSGYSWVAIGGITG